MSDDDKTSEKSIEPAQEETCERKVPEAQQLFGRPVEGFVRGGTHTSKHDADVAAQREDADHRRAVSDKERQIASVPIEHGGGMLATHKLTDSPGVEPLHVLLKYLTPRGEDVYHKGKELQGLADIVVVGPEELCLQIVCLGCKDSGRHQESCQLTIRTSNKRWHLDRTQWDGQSMTFPHRQGQPFTYEGKVYISAGVVMESEKFRCPDCNWTARIDRNCVWPD